jgi:hypothetical protein
MLSKPEARVLNKSSSLVSDLGVTLIVTLVVMILVNFKVLLKSD